MLSIKHVSKKFKNHTVLNNIELEIKDGSIAIFLGGSGVGKSTLLRILSGLESADSGSITIDDKPLKESGINHVGMVFQNFNLFDHLTAVENITLPLIKAHNIQKKDALRIAHELLTAYDLKDKAQKYPSQLSGGQKQRLAIARAVALKPNIICMDEPTSALDPLLTNYVAQTISNLAQKKYTIIIATHDTALLNVLDATIYLMKDGSIIEYADTKKFNKNQDAYPQIKTFVSGSI